MGPKVGTVNMHYKLLSFLKGKMDDINPYSKHNKTDEQPDTDEVIPDTPGGVIEEEYTSELEQETSFRETSQRTRLEESFIKKLYHVLSEETSQAPKVFHFDNFELRDGNCTTKARVDL